MVVVVVVVAAVVIPLVSTMAVEYF